MSIETSTDAKSGVNAGRRNRRQLAKRIAAWGGFLVLVGLALIGAWSIYQTLTDPRRLARLAVEDGSAASALRGALAKQRVCAPVLDRSEPFAMYSSSSLELPSVQALLAAGLIERVPDADLPKGARYPLYRMSRAAAPFMRTHQMGDRRLVSLCYGRPKLGWVYLEGDGSLEPDPVLRFTYSVGDRPAWADRPDIRAAFPFLRDVTEQPIHHYRGIRFGGDTVPELEDLSIDPAMDVPSAISGFGYCPLGEDPQASCKVDN